MDLTVDEQREYEEKIEGLEYDDLADFACETKDKDKAIRLEMEIGTAIINAIPFRLNRLFDMVDAVCEQYADEKDIPQAAKDLREKVCTIIRDVIGDEIQEKIVDDIISDSRD